MLNILLLIFAAAMMFACVRHLLAFVRRERVLRDMHLALVDLYEQMITVLESKLKDTQQNLDEAAELIDRNRKYLEDVDRLFNELEQRGIIISGFETLRKPKDEPS